MLNCGGGVVGVFGVLLPPFEQESSINPNEIIEKKERMLARIS